MVSVTGDGLGELGELLHARTFVMEGDASQASDDQVRRLMAQGDYRAALEALVRGYQHLIVRHCTAMLGDAAHGEEVAQEVFLGAYAAMPRFRQEASHPHLAPGHRPQAVPQGAARPPAPAAFGGRPAA